MKYDRILWKLLRRNVSKLQLAGFAVANLVGLGIVLLALQFYSDVRPAFLGEDSYVRKDYLVVTKYVNSLSAFGSLLGGGAGEFSDAEIADIASQPWTTSVGKFTTSAYRVYASVSLGGRNVSLRTSMFFESVPDEYIDVKTDDWTFDPEHPEIPVILSKDYLSLYNFGYAASQGLPQLSEKVVGSIPIEFRLSYDDGRREYVKGRIVGFSNRLNTIVVPQSFMDWSNARYAAGRSGGTSRLIVEINSPGNPDIETYMDAHGYEVAGDKMNSSKAGYLLNVVTAIVIAVGLIISLLSFFILSLSIGLLLQKNVRKLQDLLLLGYSPTEVSGLYIRMVGVVNLFVLLFSIAFMLCCRAWYMPYIEAMSGVGGSVWLPVAVGTAVILLITAGNVVTIRRKVASLWYVEK